LTGAVLFVPAAPDPMAVHQHRFLRIISGEGRGPLDAAARGVLWAASWCYRRAVDYRNRRYDRNPALTTWLDRPVISVGNITTGGAGKTPLVVWLAQRLIELGRRPAVVCRGYKAPTSEPNDEMRLICRRVPRAVCISNPHRIAAAQYAIEEEGAEVIVLDDGFQHRGLGRLLDIVLVDATCPFGYGHLLPRGLLREPVENLSRAHLIVLTRCDQVGGSELARISERISRAAPGKPILRSEHRVVAVTDLNGHGTAEGATDGRRALCFAAVGNPRSFARTCEILGYELVRRVWWPDHHHYRVADAEEVMSLARGVAGGGADVLLTTEKDAVKLAHLPVVWWPPVRVVQIEIQFREGGDRILLNKLREALETCGRAVRTA